MHCLRNSLFTCTIKCYCVHKCAKYEQYATCHTTQIKVFYLELQFHSQREMVIKMFGIT